MNLGTLVLAMGFTLALAPAAPAQTTSTIMGTVVDAEGGVLPGVTVTARHVDTGLTRETVTGGEGRFALAALPVGAYELRASLAGFKPLVRRGIALTVGETAAITLALEIGAIGEEITVVAETPLVNTRTSELSYLVGERTIERLPLNGRNYTDLAQLQPGVAAFPHRDGGSVVAHGLGMSVNGQDPRSNVYLLDGTLQNDFTNGPAGSAAGTALGTETIREFRVEANAYSAEFGRNTGGQIIVLTKSGTNRFRGSAYEFHRNEALDARDYFDRGEKPEFLRNQFGGTVGGPIRRDRAFFFFGYEALRETLGRTVSTVVPDDNARRGILPAGAVPVDPLVAPYLAEYPVANGANLGGGLAEHFFNFDQRLNQDFLQGRVDYQPDPSHQFFARHTLDDAEQRLPTDFPQFPRSFVSRNQFLTAEYRRVFSASTLGTFRFGYSRTRIGQDVESNVSQALSPFVPGRPTIGAIDIGGIPRFGPQISADVQLNQDVYSFQYDLVRTRDRHLFKAGVLVERYVAEMVNPTFSRGIFRFASLESFLRNQPALFIGLTPEGDFARHWPFTLFGFYVQDEFQAAPSLTLNAGLRYEPTTLPKDTEGRDSTLIALSDAEPTLGELYQNPTPGNLSPRAGFAWDPGGDGRTAIRGGYGLYFNTNNQQNLIVTVTNPPFTPRPVIPRPTFPVPPFDRGGSISIRPVQWNLENPRLHVWNVSLQREIGFDTVVTLGYAGSRGRHLLRSGDVNVPVPEALADGTPYFPPTAARPNPAFSTIELKSSDGDSWYKAFLFEVRRRWSGGFQLQSSYTLSSSVDTTQASTFFSDATNGTTSAFPEFVPGYNKGPSDFDARHNWVLSVVWDLPVGRGLDGVSRALLEGWQLSGVARMRSGNPLTVFVASNWSRSRWAPSLGPGIGSDRPGYAPGHGPDSAVIGSPDRWFDPAAFMLQPAGTFGDTGRGDFTGPNLRTVDLALVKEVAWPALGAGTGRLELRIEAFNLFNRVNFGNPDLIAFAGTAAGEAPLASFGRIRSTVTSARQVQLGVRVSF